MLVFASFPTLTTARKAIQEPNDQSAGTGWTFMRGFITKPQYIERGNVVTFRALHVHFYTEGSGMTRHGVLVGLHKIILPNSYQGIVNTHYVFAMFNGVLT